MFSRFFIDRPIFASVLSIVVVLAGGISLTSLPVTQYPQIAPPTIEVSAVFPGANALVVADTVAAPIEQQVNGVESMMYMSSQCTNDGGYSLTVTFASGTDMNLAQILVQNRVNLAVPILPDLVRRRGVSVKKKSPAELMIVNLFSPDGSRDNLYLSNYATIQIKDELLRLPGIGDIRYLGQRDYSMRLWLDPDKMAARNLSAGDVVRAVEQQNAQVAAGQIGQPPAPDTQVFQYAMSTLGRLADAEQFADMILKADADGRTVRMRDVARIELGAQSYDQVCMLDGKPSVALAIYQLPTSNALYAARGIRERMAELKNRFPDGVDYAIVYDTTPFIDESVREVFKTLRDAVILVGLVMLVFLQNWRSALIPLIAVPVAIVGTFAAMAALGYSLNNLTLFGLVLAIGIVVDDAIVVVEAVERHIEGGLAPRAAAIRAMEEVSGPVVAIGLVLSAVFVPCIFIAGIVGEFFRQFALTIAVSTILSAFNSLTLSPALAALLLGNGEGGRRRVLPAITFPILFAWLGWRFGPEAASAANAEIADQWPWIVERFEWACAAAGFVCGFAVAGTLDRLLAKLFSAFNAAFDQSTSLYLGAVRGLLRGWLAVMLIYAGLVYLTWHSFESAPTGFIPSQDKGYLLVNLQLPDSSSLERTEEVIRRADRIARATAGVKHAVSIAGLSTVLNAGAPNFGAMYVMLDDFSLRTRRGLTADRIAAQLRSKLNSAIPDGTVNVVGGPPVDGLGTAGGFKIIVEDRGNAGFDELQRMAEEVSNAAAADPRLKDLFTSFRANTPWLHVDVDREAARSMGVSAQEIFNALQVQFGSLYINDFNRFGRTWQVNVQADARFRNQTDDIRRLKVRNENGQMMPLGSVVRIRDVNGPVLVNRYNMYYSAPINGMPAAGVSSGQAIDAMDSIAADRLPSSMRAEWTELALLQLKAGNSAMWAFLLAVVLVFLVLAAQYENWSLPLAVIFVVPMCLLCAVEGIRLAELDINVFTQIGFVVLVGLASKNSILIVEFAKARREAGAGRREATLEACRLRLRPIIMTSFAFILGVVPLMAAKGAGSEMRRTLGVAVFSGMLGVTMFGIFLTPIFYYVIQSIADWRLADRSLPKGGAVTARQPVD